MISMFPIASFDVIDNDLADEKLVAWGHWLGGCHRPFGRQSFGLWIENELVAVAVSASTVNGTCGGYERRQVVELARLCAAPNHRDMTRVALRLWRKVAPAAWHYWPVRALVSYANALRHSGDIYRFDGWRKVGDAAGSKSCAGGGWNRRATRDPKTIWAFDLGTPAAAAAVPELGAA